MHRNLRTDLSNTELCFRDILINTVYYLEYLQPFGFNITVTEHEDPGVKIMCSEYLYFFLVALYFTFIIFAYMIRSLINFSFRNFFLAWLFLGGMTFLFMFIRDFIVYKLLSFYLLHRKALELLHISFFSNIFAPIIIVLYSFSVKKKKIFLYGWMQIYLASILLVANLNPFLISTKEWVCFIIMFISSLFTVRIWFFAVDIIYKHDKGINKKR